MSSEQSSGEEVEWESGRLDRRSEHEGDREGDFLFYTATGLYRIDFFFLASNNCRSDDNKVDRREYKMMAQLWVSIERGFSPLQVPSTLVCVQHFLHSVRIQNEFVFF